MRKILLFATLALLLTACNTTEAPEPEPADPYATYQSMKPEGAVDLSREDAQARAYLGCLGKLALSPGTVDYALRMAYYPHGCP